VQYQSTRGRAPVLEFEDVLLTGLARDGGLYVPTEWPQVSSDDIRALAGESYVDAATRIMAPYVQPSLTTSEFGTLVEEAYKTFNHAAVTPLTQLDSNDWLLELYHGPTLAFKDVALQLLGRLFDHVLTKRDRKITIVGATSGDTGSAAIEACRDKDTIEIFMLHPKGRVSEVQRRQMTTVQSANVHNIAVEATFDDCQAMVKDMFNDLAFRDALSLSAVNSINWARVMAQIVYYFTSAVALGAPDRKTGFAVPTGNFGDVYAGYVAAQMGLPIAQLVVATNVNDILTRALRSGEYVRGEVTPTISPSMDIQVSSNFERLLFDLYDHRGDRISALMDDFGASGQLHIEGDALSRAHGVFDSERVGEEQTLATIASVYAKTGELIDPHTAVGVAAAHACRRYDSFPMVTLATAHAAKFPDAVKQATGVHPALPKRLDDLLERDERYETLPNDLQAVKEHICRTVGVEVPAA